MRWVVEYPKHRILPKLNTVANTLFRNYEKYSIVLQIIAILYVNDAHNFMISSPRLNLVIILSLIKFSALHYADGLFCQGGIRINRADETVTGFKL